MTIKFTDVSPVLNLPVWPSRQGPTIIEVKPKAYAKVMSHLTDETAEQGGLLIGRAWASASLSTDTPANIARVEIVEAIASASNVATGFSLQMGTQVWTAANARIAQLAQDGVTPLLIVGWFHSHPRLSAFFSATDRATQSAFFNHAYSVGWVIDPFAALAEQRHAFFLGPNSIQISVETVA
jgi:proteasome lid subunit RPN8/RPN11